MFTAIAVGSSQVWPWLATIGSTLFMFLGMNPEPKPDPYADLGIICIALVFLYLIYQTIKHVRSYCRIKKSLKEA